MRAKACIILMVHADVEVHMFKHMLVATDGSKLSEEAVAYAISIAAAVNARVTAICVVQPVHMIVPTPLPETISENFASRMEEQSKAAMAFVEKTARNAGIRVNLVAVRKEQPYEAIIETDIPAAAISSSWLLTGFGPCRGSCWVARRRRCWPKVTSPSWSIARRRQPMHEAGY